MRLPTKAPIVPRSGLAKGSLAADVELVSEDHEVEQREFAVAVEVRSRIPRDEQVDVGQEVEHVQAAVLVDVGPAGFGGAP